MSKFLDDSEDFAVLSKPPRAPKRPPKHPTDPADDDANSTAIVVGDTLLGASTSTTSTSGYWNSKKNSDEEQQQTTDSGASCLVCNKSLEHMNETRRTVHINACLDQQEAASKLQSKTTEWSTTLDCPLCGEALPPGPHRAAHAKRCGRLHSVSAADLLKLMNTQTNIADSRRKRGLAHTKAEQPTIESVTKRPKRNELLPRSLLDEQIHIAKALSMSTSSEDSFADFVNPKSFERSKPVLHDERVAPVDCRCAAINALHERFVARVRQKELPVSTFPQLAPGSLTESSVQVEKWSTLALQSAEKIERLERLADDLAAFLKQSADSGDIGLIAMEGTAVRVHRFILQARCPKLLQAIGDDSQLSLCEYSEATLRSYVKFVYSASRQWQPSQLNEMTSLAKRFGPAGLLAQCRKSGALVSEDQSDVVSDPQVFDTAADDVLLLVESERSRRSSHHFVEADDAVHQVRSPTPDWFANSAPNSPGSIRRQPTPTADESIGVLDRPVEELADGSGDLTSVRVEMQPSAVSAEIRNKTPTDGSDDLTSVRVAMEPSAVNTEILNKTPLDGSGDLTSVRVEMQLSAVSAEIRNKTPMHGSGDLKSVRVAMEPSVVSTEIRNKTPKATKLVRHRSQPVLGSNVKVLKTTDITPMPNYSAMDTPQLKAELAKYGVRPLGKRKAIPLLKDIYEETHPIASALEISTPKTTQSFVPAVVVDGDDATLNESFEGEVAEESSMNSDEETLVDPKDVAAMNTALVRWFRLDENADLHLRVLSLQTITFEEIHSRIMRAPDAVSTVSKELLTDFLDKQHITFSVPSNGNRCRKSKRGRRGGRLRGGGACDR